MDVLHFLKTLMMHLYCILSDSPYSTHQIKSVHDGFGDERPMKQYTRYCLEMIRISKIGTMSYVLVDQRYPNNE